VPTAIRAGALAATVLAVTMGATVANAYIYCDNGHADQYIIDHTDYSDSHTNDYTDHSDHNQEHTNGPC